MSLGRAWMQELCRASGAALIGPAATVGSLIVLVIAGGLGRLGAIGQVLSGPSLALASSLATGSTARSNLPPLALLNAPAGSPSAGAGSTGAPSTGGTPPGLRSPGGSRSGSPGQSRHPGSGRQPSPTVRAVSPAPTPQPTAVDQVVALGTSLTSKLPGQAGAIATQAVRSVGGTLDRILPPAPAGVQLRGSKAPTPPLPMP